MEKHFLKYVDDKGNILYKEEAFDYDTNKFVGMNIVLGEKNEKPI